MDEQLRPLAVAADDGHRTIRADLYIADRLKTILLAHGAAFMSRTTAWRLACTTAAGTKRIPASSTRSAERIPWPAWCPMCRCVGVPR